MPQNSKSSHTDKRNRRAEQNEAGREEKGVGTKASEARVWAAANKLARDADEQFREDPEII